MRRRVIPIVLYDLSRSLAPTDRGVRDSLLARIFQIMLNMAADEQHRSVIIIGTMSLFRTNL